MSISNQIALSGFVDFNKIDRDDFGRCVFQADITIRASGRGGSETLEGRISFASGDSEQLTISVLEAGKLPLGYKTDYGTWTHTGELLTIKGKYKNFNYVTEVKPAS